MFRRAQTLWKLALNSVRQVPSSNFKSISPVSNGNSVMACQNIEKNSDFEHQVVRLFPLGNTTTTTTDENPFSTIPSSSVQMQDEEIKAVLSEAIHRGTLLEQTHRRFPKFFSTNVILRLWKLVSDGENFLTTKRKKKRKGTFSNLLSKKENISSSKINEEHFAEGLVSLSSSSSKECKKEVNGGQDELRQNFEIARLTVTLRPLLEKRTAVMLDMFTMSELALLLNYICSSSSSKKGKEGSSLRLQKRRMYLPTVRKVLKEIFSRVKEEYHELIRFEVPEDDEEKNVESSISDPKDVLRILTILGSIPQGSPPKVKGKSVHIKRRGIFEVSPVEKKVARAMMTCLLHSMEKKDGESVLERGKVQTTAEVDISSKNIKADTSTELSVQNNREAQSPLEDCIRASCEENSSARKEFGQAKSTSSLIFLLKASMLFRLQEPFVSSLGAVLSEKIDELSLSQLRMVVSIFSQSQAQGWDESPVSLIPAIVDKVVRIAEEVRCENEVFQTNFNSTTGENEKRKIEMSNDEFFQRRRLRGALSQIESIFCAHMKIDHPYWAECYTALARCLEPFFPLKSSFQLQQELHLPPPVQLLPDSFSSEEKEGISSMSSSEMTGSAIVPAKDLSVSSSVSKNIQQMNDAVDMLSTLIYRNTAIPATSHLPHRLITYILHSRYLVQTIPGYRNPPNSLKGLCTILPAVFLTRYSLSPEEEKRLLENVITHLEEIDKHALVSAMCVLPLQTLSPRNQSRIVTRFAQVATTCHKSFYAQGLLSLTKVQQHVDRLSIQYIVTAMEDKTFVKRFSTQDMCTALQAMHLLKMGEEMPLALRQLMRMSMGKLEQCDSPMELATLVEALQHVNMLPNRNFISISQRLLGFVAGLHPHQSTGEASDHCSLPELLSAFKNLSSIYLSRKLRSNDMFEEVWHLIRDRCIEEGHQLDLWSAIGYLNCFSALNYSDEAVAGVLQRQMEALISSEKLATKSDLAKHISTVCSQLKVSGCISTLSYLVKRLQEAIGKKQTHGLNSNYSTQTSMMIAVLLQLLQLKDALYPLDVVTAIPIVLEMMTLQINAVEKLWKAEETKKTSEADGKEKQKEKEKEKEKKDVSEENQSTILLLGEKEETEGTDQEKVEDPFLVIDPELMQKLYDILRKYARDMFGSDAIVISSPSHQKQHHADMVLQSTEIPEGHFVRILSSLAKARILDKELILLSMRKIRSDPRKLKEYELVGTIIALDVLLTDGKMPLSPLKEKASEAKATKKVVDEIDREIETLRLTLEKKLWTQVLLRVEHLDDKEIDVLFCRAFFALCQTSLSQVFARGNFELQPDVTRIQLSKKIHSWYHFSRETEGGRKVNSIAVGMKKKQQSSGNKTKDEVENVNTIFYFDIHDLLISEITNYLLENKENEVSESEAKHHDDDDQKSMWVKLPQSGEAEHQQHPMKIAKILHVCAARNDIREAYIQQMVKKSSRVKDRLDRFLGVAVQSQHQGKKEESVEAVAQKKEEEANVDADALFDMLAE